MPNSKNSKNRKNPTPKKIPNAQTPQSKALVVRPKGQKSGAPQPIGSISLAISGIGMAMKLVTPALKAAIIFLVNNDAESRAVQLLTKKLHVSPDVAKKVCHYIAGSSKWVAGLKLLPPAEHQTLSAAQGQLLRHDRLASSGASINESGGFSWSGPNITTETVNGILHTRVIGRDYLELVQGAAGFNVYAWRLNPGLPVFRWLSNIAANYQQYKFNTGRLVFQTAVSTTKDGTVMMMADTDATDPVPEGEAQFMTNSHAVTAPVWQASLNYDIPKEGLNSLASHYVRTGPVPVGQDIRLSDSGIMYLAYDLLDTSLIGAAIGRVFFEYDITFAVPHTDDRAIADLNTFVQSYVSANASSPFAGGTPVGGLAPAITYPAVNKIAFALPGFYMLIYSIAGSGSPTIAVNLSDTNCEHVFTNICSTTTMNSATISIHVKQPGQYLGLLLGGTITSACIAVARRAGIMAASHSVASTQGRVHYQAPMEFGSDVIVPIRETSDNSDYVVDEFNP